MNIPNRYKAKGIDGNWYEGYYFQFPETTYCIKEDYESHPPEIIHGLIFHQMTDWGLPNKLEWSRIDPDTLEKIPYTLEEIGALSKKTKWIDTDNYYYRWQCSECGMYTRDPEPNFCPWCGTDMRDDR